MITFKQFIHEDRKSEDSKYSVKAASSTNELIDMLRKNCSGSIQGAKTGSNSRMFRGWKSLKKSGIYTPSDGERVSANTTNFYTQLLDTNPLNAQWPKRSKSFIASTSRNSAMGYADDADQLTEVFTFDSTDIGVLPTFDIWKLHPKFKRLGFDEPIKALNSLWQEIQEESGYKVDSMQSLIEAIDNMDYEKLSDLVQDNTPFDVMRSDMSYEEVAKALIADLPKAFSWLELDATRTKQKTLSARHREVWFSGPCVVVNSKDTGAVYEEFGLEKFQG